MASLCTPPSQAIELRRTLLDATRGGRPAQSAGVSFHRAHLETINLSGANLSSCNFSGADLRGAQLEGCDLVGANLTGANLAGANLRGAKLDTSEFMAADLSGADLAECHAAYAGFGGANLSGANLAAADFTGSTFTHANLGRANLSGAILQGARLREVKCQDAVFCHANLQEADLTGTEVSGADFLSANLRSAHLKGLTGARSARWIGVDIRDVDFCGAYLIRRLIVDENYLHEFRTQTRLHRALYTLWWLTSDCGRSFIRWGICTALVVFGFAGLFMTVDVDYGAHRTWLSPLYYSVVTLTTLGYGDVLPASPAAQILAMAEVVLGYLALGGLLGIFANKMGRRAD